MQRGQLLQAHQNTLLVRHQHKDAVGKNIAELEAAGRQSQQSAVTSEPVLRHDETLRADTRGSRSISGDNEVDENQSPVPHTTETRSHASSVHEPVILKRNAYVRRSFDSSGYDTESFKRRVPLEVLNCLTGSLGQRTSNSLKRDSSLSSPLRPAVSNVAGDHTSSASDVPSLSAVSDCNGESQLVNSVGTESGLPLVYMPPLTVSVTHVPVLNSRSRSPHYFDRLEVLSPFDGGTIIGHAVSTSALSDEVFNSNSLPLKKPNCAFASKSVIANTYLSRRPPVFSPVCVGTTTQSDAADGLSTVDSHTDNSSLRLNHSATAHTTNCDASPTTKPSDTKRPSVAEQLVTTAVSSQLLSPPSYSNSEAPCSLHSSLPDRHKAYSTSVSSQASQTADISNNAGMCLSADFTDGISAASLLTDTVAASSSLAAVVTCPSSTFVPFHTLSATCTSSVSLLSSLSSPQVPVRQVHLPASLSSDSSVGLLPDSTSVKLLSEIVHLSSVTTPQVSALSSCVAASFQRRSSYSGAASSTCTVTVSVLSQITSVSQTDESVKQSPDVPRALNVPSLCHTKPCTLTISSHTPVSSSSIDTTTLLHTSHNTSAVCDSGAKVSSSSDLSQSRLITTDVDIPESLLLLLSPFHKEAPLSEAASEHTGATDVLVSDLCLPQDIPSLPSASQLYSNSPRMTRRRLSSDSAHASHFSPSLPDAEQKHEDDSVAQTNISVLIDKTAEEPAPEAKNSAIDCKSSEVRDALSDDASSDIVPLEGEPDPVPVVQTLVMRRKQKDGSKTQQRVSFSPLALLLDASLEGDLELVMEIAKKVP